MIAPLSLEQRAALEIDLILMKRGANQENGHAIDPEVLNFLTVTNPYMVTKTVKGATKYLITDKGMNFYDKEFKFPYSTIVEERARRAGTKKTA